MKSIAKRRLFGALFVVLLLCSHGNAFANSAPPPTRIWLTFTYTSPEPPTLEGIQLAICETEICESPVQLLQYGICNTGNCILNPPAPPERSTFECADDKCLAMIAHSSNDYDFYKIIAQFTDGTRTSEVFTGLSKYGGTKKHAFYVENNETLVRAERFGEDLRNPVEKLHPLLPSLLLTLGVELGVAGIGLWLFKQNDRASLASRLLSVFLINLLTYPLVWLIFPTLRRFQPQYLRAMSPFVGIIVLLYAAATVWIYTTRNKKRRTGIIVTVVSLPFVAICLLAALFATAYGNEAIAVPGLSAGLSLLLTEISVILMETVLLYVLNHKTLSWKLAGALSLTMNLASFLAGQVIFQ